jgi:hypothetical protein
MPNLLAGHEKKPAHPLPEGPRPGTKYRVQDGETWETVAKKHGVTVQELIANNCGAHVSKEEINWYLHFRIGCNVSKDGWKNWAFSSSASPGIVYVPVRAGAPAVVSQNPKINTLYGDPKDLGCGGMRWLVEFELPAAAGADGWIIQQLDRSYDVREPNGSVSSPQLNTPKKTYWEAWPVRKGKTHTANRTDPTEEGVTYDDSFDQPQRPGTKGTFQVMALAKFFEGNLPPSFRKQNPDTRAEDLFSSIVKPPFWDGTGTVHNLTVTWDCTPGSRDTSTKSTPQVFEKK